MHARADAMEGAVRGRERKGVVGADDEGLACGCDACNRAIYHAPCVFFAPEQGVCGGKEYALVAAGDEHGCAGNAAGAHARQQVLRVSVDRDNV